MAGGDLDDLYGGDVEAEEEREEEAEVARIRWSIPEMAVVVALVTTGALAVSGVVGGVAVALTVNPLSMGPGFSITADAMTDASWWASFVLALVLLGALWICLHEVDAGSVALPDEGTAGEGIGQGVLQPDPMERVRRAALLAVWVRAALALIALGAAASFAGTVIMVNGPASRGSSWIGFIPGLSSDVVTIALGVTGIIAWNLVGRPPAREA